MEEENNKAVKRTSGKIPIYVELVDYNSNTMYVGQ